MGHPLLLDRLRVILACLYVWIAVSIIHAIDRHFYNHGWPFHLSVFVLLILPLGASLSLA